MAKARPLGELKQVKDNIDFDPAKNLPDLSGKVIFITGGTAGLGKSTITHLVEHNPEHIYFSGRNESTAKGAIAQMQRLVPTASLTFVPMDLTSLDSVKTSITEHFRHERLDILICNAGIMASPPGLSKDGIEIQFATNHVGHAMVIKQLLPVLLRTADEPNSDVRIVNLTSQGWAMHHRGGIQYDTLNTTQEGFFLGSWFRYGSSKFANLLYPIALAKRYPQITSVAVHPGRVYTPLCTNQTRIKFWFLEAMNWLMGIKWMTEQQGSYSQLWCAAAATKSQLVNGAYYIPIGHPGTEELTDIAKDPKSAERLWEWTEQLLSKY